MLPPDESHSRVGHNRRIKVSQGPDPAGCCQLVVWFLRRLFYLLWGRLTTLAWAVFYWA